MATEVPKILIGMGMLIATAFLLLSFLSMLMINYDVDTTQFDNTYDIIEYNDTLNSIQGSSDNVRGLFDGQGNIFGDMLKFFWNGLEDFYNLVTIPFGLFASILYTLGVPSIIVTLIQSAIIMILIFSILYLIFGRG